MTNRTEAALAIRDAALEKFRAEGRFQNIQHFGPVCVWPDPIPSKAAIQMVLRTPFQKIPERAPSAPQKGNLSYGLDIWTQGGKVLNIEWDTQERTQIVSFKRGVWEASVLSWAG